MLLHNLITLQRCDGSRVPVDKRQLDALNGCVVHDLGGWLLVASWPRARGRLPRHLRYGAFAESRPPEPDVFA